MLEKTISTEIDIPASAEQVWHILIDFTKYPEWNPFINNIKGEPREHNRLTVEIKPPGRKMMVFKPIITHLVPNKQLSWRGRVVVPGIFDGYHSFELKERGNGRVRFKHHETFSGLLTPFLWKSMKNPIQEGFTMMNEALKQRSQSPYNNSVETV